MEMLYLDLFQWCKSDKGHEVLVPKYHRVCSRVSEI